MPLTPLALPPCPPSELLTHVLAHQAYPTTLIICSTRTAFLSSLVEAVSPVEPPANSAPSVPQRPDHDVQDPEERPEPGIEGSGHQEKPPIHPLLKPTLHQVASSRHLATAFTHTISHLRAYLSVFPFQSPNPVPRPPVQQFDKPGTKTPLLVVYGLVALHKDTSEWSAQGLGTTLASLVEAGSRAGVRIMLVEEREVCTMSHDRGDGNGETAETVNEGQSELHETERQSQERSKSKEVWMERLPILNGSTRRPGLDSGNGWSGRTVDVQSVLKRWFLPGSADWAIIK